MDLTNKFLLATRKIKDKMYSNSIVYIISHDNKGTVGVIINKKLNYMIRESVYHTGYNFGLEKLFPEDLHFGGCNNIDKSFLLYLNGNTNSYHVIDNEITDHISSKQHLIIVGQIIWGIKELEHEIMNGEWIVTDADYNIIYDQDNYLKVNSLIKYIGAKDLCFFDWGDTSENIQ